MFLCFFSEGPRIAGWSSFVAVDVFGSCIRLRSDGADIEDRLEWVEVELREAIATAPCTVGVPMLTRRCGAAVGPACRYA